jgi:hypothetical protein
MSNHAKLPWWLKPANRIIIALYRLGWAFGTWYVLSVPGRKTGKLRSTPVSVLVVDGRRYIVTGFETNWVKNTRAVGWGFLTRGGKKERVALVELPVEERPPILREFPRQVPHGVEYFERLLGLPNDPEAFVEAAPRCPVFRVDNESEDRMKEVANSSAS